MSWHTLSRPSCQQKSAHRSWEVKKQRELRVKFPKCQVKRDGICSRRPGCSGDPQLGLSYGRGNLGLIGPHGYLVQRVDTFLVLHHAE